MAVYTDDFNRANGAIDVGNANWVAAPGKSMPAITSSVVGLNAVVGAYYNQTFNNDQYSQATLNGLNQGFAIRDAFLFVRGNASDQEKYALAVHSSDNGDTGYDVTITIYYVNAAGATTFLNSAGPIIDIGGNGLWKLAITGTSINVYREGVFQVGVTDGTIAGGKPGFYGIAGGAGPTADNFEAGDIGGGAPVAERKTAIYMTSGTVGGRPASMALWFTPDGQKHGP